MGGYVKAAPGRAAHAVAEDARAVGGFVKRAPGRVARGVVAEARVVASAILSKL